MLRDTREAQNINTFKRFRIWQGYFSSATATSAAARWPSSWWRTEPALIFELFYRESRLVFIWIPCKSMDFWNGLFWEKIEKAQKVKSKKFCKAGFWTQKPRNSYSSYNSSNRVWIKKIQGQKCRHVSTFDLFFCYLLKLYAKSKMLPPHPLYDNE